MNKTIEEFARNTIKDGISRLPEGNQNLFKLMYGRNNGKRSCEDAVLMSIDDVIKEMPAEKLDWALTQIENSKRG